MYYLLPFWGGSWAGKQAVELRPWGVELRPHLFAGVFRPKTSGIYAVELPHPVRLSYRSPLLSYRGWGN